MALIRRRFLFIYIVFLLLILNDNLNSQTLTSSPYSRFGIGDIVMPGFGRSRAMGSTGIASRNPFHLNNQNPASYSSLDSLTFIYEFGVLGKETQYITSNQRFDDGNANINFLSIGFPLSKVWFISLGLAPFSNCGYNIQTDTTNTNIGTVENNYSGSGGVNQFYIGNSFKISKKFSVGFNASYLFGSIVQLVTTSFPDDANSFEISNQKEIKVSDFYFHYGLQYSDSIAHKLGFTIGLVFDNQSKIHTSNSQFATNYLSSNSSGTLDTLINSQVSGHILFPFSGGIGIAISKNNSLTVEMDYIRENWANSKFYGQIDTLVNSNYYGFGLEYVPDIYSISNYSKRISYRFGGHYANTYLKLKGIPINDYGISFGVGFPFRKTKTTFNISVELGTRGTTQNNLIKENYGIITLNLTFFDNWFIRKKFD